MNQIIEKFGQLVGEETKKNPSRTRGILSAVYRLAGLQAQYFPSKALLPARQYMAAVSAKSIVSPLNHPDKAAIVSIFLPCEILHAAGLLPLFPEGLSCYLAASACERVFIETAEENGVPETMCSYHKILIGLALTNVMSKPLFVLNTTLACDANQLSFRKIAEHYDVPHFVLDIPNKFDDNAVKYVADGLREMTSFIEKCTGKKIDENAIRESVARSRRTIELYKKYLDLRAERYISDEMTSEMYSVFATHVMLGTPEAEKYVSDLVKQTEKLPVGRKGSRILWVHTLPYWQDSLREILNFREDCEVIACDMTFDSLTDMDENHPYESMAKRVLECSFNGEAERRVKLVGDMAEKLHADGVVWFCHWGCKQTLGASQYARKELEERGFTTLVLDGDGCDRSNINDGQMLTRVQSFLETFKGKAM